MQTDTIVRTHETAPSWSTEIDLIDRPTPFLMLDLEKVSRAYSSLRAALRDFRIHYAMKANSQPEILDTLAQLGSGFEVASAAELQILIGRGIPTDNVMFSNTVRRRSIFGWGTTAASPHSSLNRTQRSSSSAWRLPVRPYTSGLRRLVRGVVSPCRRDSVSGRAKLSSC